MNYTESFQEFANRVTSMDLMLYAGVGVVLYVLFKEKLSPVQVMLSNFVNRLSGLLKNSTATTPVVPGSKQQEDLFFKLICSWKQTRDLAVKSGCVDAVKVVDQMFPYLSPHGCEKDEVKS